MAISARLMGFFSSGMICPRTKTTISAGTSVTDSRAAEAMAKVLVKASGPNSRPSCDSSVKIGRNDTVMISNEKTKRAHLRRGGDEDLDARLVLRRSLQVLVGVLDHDDGRVDHGANGDGDAAEAHDVRAHAERPHRGEGMRMPTGSIRMATRALLKCSRKMMQTAATTRLSSTSVCFKVSMARSISCERS